MAINTLTLELSGISLVLSRFSSYVPRQIIIDQRPQFSTSPYGAPITRAIGFEPKNTLRFSVLTTDDAVITKLEKLRKEQDALIIAKTYTGITVSDEMHRFFEKSALPTRQKTALAVTNEGDGYISYFAKFLMGMSLTYSEPSGKATIANVIMIELGKLV